jgi:hypothetical protein
MSIPHLTWISLQWYPDEFDGSVERYPSAGVSHVPKASSTTLHETPACAGAPADLDGIPPKQQTQAPVQTRENVSATSEEVSLFREHQGWFQFQAYLLSVVKRPEATVATDGQRVRASGVKSGSLCTTVPGSANRRFSLSFVVAPTSSVLVGEST